MLSQRYRFFGQEVFYKKRPQCWPKKLAAEALKKVGTQKNKPPTVVCVGSGTGADALPFLKLGCIVYCVEPNVKFREIASDLLAKKYPHQFISVDGDCHSLNLPEKVTADLIVVAQALHTFQKKFTGKEEFLIVNNWKKYLPNDGKDRIAIWYYNLDPIHLHVRELHALLSQYCPDYAKSQTQLVDAELFDPKQFQDYIELERMIVSLPSSVDGVILKQEDLQHWFASYSFYPKSDPINEKRVMEKLNEWFCKHKDSSGLVRLPYIASATQGPLRSDEYKAQKHENRVAFFSPISSLRRKHLIDNTAPFWSVNLRTKL